MLSTLRGWPTTRSVSKSFSFSTMPISSFTIFPSGMPVQNDFDNWYKNLTALLKEEPTRGFPVSHSDSYQYALQRGENEDHPLLASSGDRAFYV